MSSSLVPLKTLRAEIDDEMGVHLCESGLHVAHSPISGGLGCGRQRNAAVVEWDSTLWLFSVPLHSCLQRRKRVSILWNLPTFVVVVLVFTRFIVDRVGFFLHESHNLVII
ncbi:hypothetical protein TNCV_1740351 [Trichonephila clavipes]|uniref:Transmembrane protein n=1 Tax=Trichonephila clavipes TaxID=2585209 RepID=A0A8X6RKH6_TRICX|nr:hypothetical protein TNCV_1740351 [Trichonephila clavipes]